MTRAQQTRTSLRLILLAATSATCQSAHICLRTWGLVRSNHQPTYLQIADIIVREVEARQLEPARLVVDRREALLVLGPLHHVARLEHEITAPFGHHLRARGLVALPFAATAAATSSAVRLVALVCGID